MTKAHSKIYDKLASKQVNRNDVLVVSYSESSATFYVRFPGLYLTYDHKGRLISTETGAERRLHGEPLANLNQTQLSLGGEVGQ